MVLHLRKQGFEARFALAPLGRDGQHLVVNVERQQVAAQRVGHAAVPHVGVQADQAFAIRLKDRVKRLCRLFERGLPLGRFLVGKGLRQVKVDLALLQPAFQPVDLGIAGSLFGIALFLRQQAPPTWAPAAAAGSDFFSAR